ncbi:MAG: hypothetical protein Kow0077_07840 [Anaerolineae bacterium]
MHSNGNATSQDTLFEAAAELGKLLGLNKSASLILAHLFTIEDAVSLDQISEDLGIAKSSNSVILKTLEQMGLVEAVHVPHDRRKFYRLVENPGERLSLLISRRLENIVSRQKPILTADAPHESELVEARQEQLRMIYRALLHLASLLRDTRAEAWAILDDCLATRHSFALPHDTQHTPR